MRNRCLSVLLIMALLLTILSCGIFAADTEVEDTYPGPDEIWYDENPVEMTLEEYLAQQADGQSAQADTTLSYSTDYPNYHVNTGDQAYDVCCAGLSQEGYTETYTDHTKYNAWFYGADVSAAWCAIFISWCEGQANVSTSVVARNALASGYSTGNMSANPYGCPAYAFGTTPRMGDIAFIGSGSTSNHVGLVVGTSASYIWCIEGNASDSVALRRYLKSSGYQTYGGGTTGSTRIIFYARPNYSGYGSHSITFDDNGNYNTGESVPVDTTTIVTTPSPSYTYCHFTDVSGDAYYSEAVKWAYENDIACGMTDTTFEPGRDCTRAQIITFLWRMAGSPQPTYYDYYNYLYYHCFADVPTDSWYYDAVVWGVNNGYVSGITSSTFEPNWTCTRAQALTFLWRLTGSPDASSQNIFEDVSPDAWYYDAVLWGSQQGIAYGMTATTYEPNRSCTRGQIVTFMHRVYQAYRDSYPNLND